MRDTLNRHNPESKIISKVSNLPKVSNFLEITQISTTLKRIDIKVKKEQDLRLWKATTKRNLNMHNLEP